MPMLHFSLKKMLMFYIKKIVLFFTDKVAFMNKQDDKLIYKKS